MRTICVAVFTLFCQALLWGQLPPKEPYPLDVRQIHSGHSLTDPLFGQPWPGQYVNLISELRGTWAGDDIGKATIPGSPMFWRWDHDHDNYGSPSARYDIDNWELLVITEGVPLPYDDGSSLWVSSDYLSRFVNNALNNGDQGNGAATLLWTTWTNIDDSDGPWRQTLDEYEPRWEQMADYANENRPSGTPPVYLIPGHRMMARLYDDIQLNLVPGISNINEFFSDNIHTNSLGDYAIAMIHYACIFNESPVGLPNDLMPNPPAGFQIPSPELALYLQGMIWEVVTNYPRTGISGLVVPVSWVDFSATRAGNRHSVQLLWRTDAETNNRGFELEHSTNASDWNRIDFIPGAGNSQLLQEYTYLHQHPALGINYYRLRQIDYDGNIDFSEVISIDLGESEDWNFEVYPNPSIDRRFRFAPPASMTGAFELRLVDLNGRILWTNSYEEGAASGGLELGFQHFPSGVYTLHLVQAQGPQEIVRIVF